MNLLASLVLTATVFAQTFPQPLGYVNDFANLLSNQTRINLELSLKDYEQQTGREIAVAIVESLQDTTIEDFAVRLFEQWQIGKKGEDNGVLFLVAKSDRQMRIEVGYGLEGVLTDIQSKKILEDIVRPSFRAGDFDGGVAKGVEAIIKTLNNEPIPNPIENKTRRVILDGDALSSVIWFGLIASTWFWSIAARSKTWWAGGVWGGALGAIVGILTVSLVVSAVAGSILVAVGLIFDYFISRAYKRAKRAGIDPPWWAGGRSGFGSGSSSGDGFGGFGGGLSGGGGASGRW